MNQKDNVKQLILVRRLFKSGEDYSYKVDPVSTGMAISLFQDSVELFLWTLNKYLDTNPKEKEQFNRLFDLINDSEISSSNDIKLAFKPEIMELNRIRVNFKHYGILPAVEEATRFRGYVYQFLEKASSDYLKSNIFDLSLCELVPYEDIKVLLISAESNLTNNSITESTYDLAKAWSLISNRFNIILPQTDQNLNNGDRLLSDLNQKVTFQNLGNINYFGYLREYLDHQRSMLIAQMCDVSMRDYAMLERTLPHASRSPLTGKWQIVSKWYKPSEDDIRKSINLITNIAIKANTILE